ncbi:VOC family protein [Elizabethkingia bruuniana]|uniref:VOC family protein n=1 Tax=Elizabethkingia bruuniana TaxID=1756149 RepID=A0A7T7V0H9_9FLAO|nr:VOC family protein [Elizabethkingia bruuniana]RBI90903.1 VOC family protein [Elizabethkingia miricola]AQX85801.1 glyoxalase [Elizabethkingia bruuniana]KUY22904.1 glyoxalase [Elizabethkingia bruuniana]OPB68652.1 glyoxalase [Elizabethkingia bruuniana]OPC57500.1 glyoxalase [Elizabethkingia bruuniana]
MSKTNPVVYFEIPVNDLQRAVKFYSAIFNFTFEKEIMDGYEMAFFPFTESKSGVTGALVKGDVYKPTKNGVILYFKTDNIENTLKKVLENSGSILYPKTLNEKFGFAVAEF